MAKKIEDYLRLYLGCEVEYRFTNSLRTTTVGRGILKGFEKTKDSAEGIMYLPEVGSSLRLLVCDIKPFLRPLSSMTEEECNDYNRLSVTLFDLNDLINQIKQESEATRFLLSKGFDLFGLIEAGLAIDKTKQSSKS